MTARDGRYIGQFRPEFSRLYLDDDLYWVVPLHAPLVLGLVGRRFVGVTTTIAYLRERHGFDVYTLGGELRRVAEERGVPIGHRRYLQDLGDRLRAEHDDPGMLARRTLRRIRADRISTPGWAYPRNVVVAGFKTVEELAVFEKLPGFAPVELRTRDHDVPPVRFRRVQRSGELREEYEADRARRMESEPQSEPLPPYGELKQSEQLAYFKGLDEIHANGHPGPRWSSKYRGRPAGAVSAANSSGRCTHLDNDTERIDDLHRATDALLAQLRPRQQVVR